jgi:hypothetical protein
MTRQRVISIDATPMPNSFMKSRREMGMGNLLLEGSYFFNAVIASNVPR